MSNVLLFEFTAFVALDNPAFMNISRHLGPELVPVENALAEGGRFRATSSEPWLRIDNFKLPRTVALVEIVYTAGLTDRVERPVIRFVLDGGGKVDILAPAASEGAGVWRGRIPPKTVEVWISPTATAGPFDFRIESFRPVSVADVARMRAASPKRAFFSASARMVRLHEEADLNLRFVLGRAIEQEFRAWRARRRRVDTVSRAWPELCVALQGAQDAHAVRRTYRSLLAQTSSSWRLALVDPAPEVAAWAAAQSASRLVLHPDLRAFARQNSLPVALLAAADRLAPGALAAFAAQFDRSPEHRLVYCDETHLAPGHREKPVFKPDWSPTRQAFAAYVGRAAFLDATLLAEIVEDGPATPEQVVDSALARLSAAEVGHVARALVECVAPVCDPERPRHLETRERRPKVGIVVPTRDRIELLAPCIESVFEKTAYPDIELLVVDNGSVEKKTYKTLTRLRAKYGRLSVLASPGPFNFSQLCNAGAQRVSGEVLLFLNNDTVVLQPEWIDNMLDFALAPDIGGVGAKLLHPSRRVQHAGVVLGMGGVASHFGEGLKEADGGWLGWNGAPHEASAVTAACLMVERAKFEAVDGFDAENLPVDLNDVDLCLRLGDRGWRTICDCRTVLLHHQSASRGGGGLRLQKVYARERAYFLERWRGTIRRDPCFNPNLSLYDTTPKLG